MSHLVVQSTDTEWCSSQGGEKYLYRPRIGVTSQLTPAGGRESLKEHDLLRAWAPARARARGARVGQRERTSSFFRLTRHGSIPVRGLSISLAREGERVRVEKVTRAQMSSTPVPRMAYPFFCYSFAWSEEISSAK